MLKKTIIPLKEEGVSHYLPHYAGSSLRSLIIFWQSVSQNMILGIVLSISAAFCWSIGAMLTRLGLRSGMRTSTATFISTLGSLPLLAALALSVNRDDLVKLTPMAILWFIMVGIVNYVMARQFNYISIKHIGVTKATPLFASSPVFAMTLAVLFLGESINVVIVIGALSILSGIYLVVTSQ